MTKAHTIVKRLSPAFVGSLYQEFVAFVVAVVQQEMS